MNGVWRMTTKILTGLSLTAMYAMPQYTISARPGVINYIEGTAYLNGVSLAGKQLRTTYVNSNDTLSTDTGKAEVLLTPGVYLRVGDNSEIRMISPSLVHAQFEVVKGEAMVEVAEIEKDSDVQVIDHGAAITLQKNGLYRFTGDNPATAAAIEGKADVVLGDKKTEIGKGHEAVLSADLTTEKFDTKKEDELYAWSNVRDEYSSAASLQTARNVSTSNYGGGWYGYGFDGWSSPGWYWNGMFGSYAWLPGYAGAFYSPFGFGFYGPGVVGYAPIMYLPGGYGYGNVKGKPVTTPTGSGSAKATTLAVAVNPSKPPAIGASSSVSPFANSVARSEMARSVSSSGFATASGGHVSVASASIASSGLSSGSGHSGSAASGGFSGGGHSGGGGGGGGSHR